MEKLDGPFMIRSRNYKEIVEYIDQPPCKKIKCLVQATCYESSSDEDNDIMINLNGPCEEAMDWFITAEIIDDELQLLRKEDGTILSAEDLKKIIRYWDGGMVFLEEVIGLPFSTINKIGIYINKRDSKYCSTNKIRSEDVKILNDLIDEAFEFLNKNPDYLGFTDSFLKEVEKLWSLHTDSSK